MAVSASAIAQHRPTLILEVCHVNTCSSFRILRVLLRRARLVSRLSAVTLVALVACQGKSGAAPQAHGEAKADAKAVAGEAKADAAAHPLRADGPKVAFGELLVEGARNGNGLLQVIGTQAGKIQDCYAKTLEEHPDVAGQLGIRFFVAADGTVWVTWQQENEEVFVTALSAPGKKMAGEESPDE